MCINVINFTLPLAPIFFISAVNMETPNCSVGLFVLNHWELIVTAKRTSGANGCDLFQAIDAWLAKGMPTAAAKIRVSTRKLTYFTHEIWSIRQRSHKLEIITAKIGLFLLSDSVGSILRSSKGSIPRSIGVPVTDSLDSVATYNINRNISSLNLPRI